MADSIENWKIILATSIPIKGTQWTISGYSWAARQTMVVIRELGIALDIGKDSEQSFTHIFITHAHYDHIKGLYTHLIENNNPPLVVVPSPSVDNVSKFVEAAHACTNHGNGTVVKWRIMGVSARNEQTFMANMMSIKNINFKIELFKCKHSIPTTGYGFIEQRSKLRDEYIGKPQKEINDAKINGNEITKIVEVCHFCFLGDTTHEVFYLDKECAISDPNLEKYGTIIVECTFLHDDEKKLAKKKKHMLWSNLKKYIVNHPYIHFVLYHFSTRYKARDIINFFSNENLENVSPLVHDYEQYWTHRLDYKSSRDLDRKSDQVATIEQLSAIDQAADHNTV
jgi:ribonuclease Z